MTQEKKEYTAKERMQIQPQPVPEQDPMIRATNFKEVSLGYDLEAAVLEAERCLQCPTKPCVKGCPVNVPIPEFIKILRDGDPVAAAKKIREANALPAVCGRVCPQESQCEALCIRTKTGASVNIGKLERFVADYEMKSGCTLDCPTKAPPTGMKAAVIGSGPSGIAVAGDLALLGHEVVMFEALHKAGGVLQYGIPEFRLPKDIVDTELEALENLGVEIRLNQAVGASVTIDELKQQGFDAFYIGVGAGLPKFMGLPGENMCGIFSANEYLTRVNLMKGYLHPKYATPLPAGKNVVVIGGGNVAMDSARTALRLGADKVSIVYRRAREQMPARIEEIHHAEEEGVNFELLTNPVEYIGQDGTLHGLKCIRMELGEPDKSGRRRPIPIEGSDFTIDCDLVVVSIGAGANPMLTQTMKDLKLNDWGYIVTDSCGTTNIEGVWAGGDIVTGAATVILAMGAGRISAKAMHEYLMMKKEERGA